MITLTNPSLVNSVLGGNSTVAYNKFVLSTITYDTIAMTVRATIRITSTIEPTMQPITGTLIINVATATLTIEVSQLDFYRQITLTGPQNTFVQTLIQSAQNDLEAGLISVLVVDGVQAPGV